MANAEVTHRAKGFLTRQIACFEAMLADLAHLETDMSGDDVALERVSKLQEAHRTKTLAMEAELQAILGDWSAAKGISDSDRQEVRALGQHARELAERLIVLEDKGRDLADARLAALRDGLDDVARGRDVLDKYGQGSKGSSSFLDTKA